MRVLVLVVTSEEQQRQHRPDKQKRGKEEDTHSLGIGRVQDAEQQLNDKAIKIQTSSQEALVKQTSVSTGLASYQFLWKQACPHP